MLHTVFAHNYEVDVNPELPGTGEWSIPQAYIPQDFKPKPTRGYLILKIETENKRQIWHVNAVETSEIWTTPNPDRILIDSIDGAFYVSTKDPEDTIKINLYGLHVTAAKEHRLLLLNDYFRVLAIGTKGIHWQAPELFFDDMNIKAIDGDTLVCTGLSLNSIEEETEIVLDLLTGKVLKGDTLQAHKPSFWKTLTWPHPRSKKPK